MHITEKQFTEENGFDRSQIRSVRFAFDRIENGAVKVHIIVERMIQRGKYAIFNTGRPWYLGGIFAACIDQSGISDEN